MSLASPSTLALAAVLDGPALWHGLVRHDVAASSALLRYLIAVPVSAAMLTVLRAVTRAYGAPAGPEPVRAVAERLDTATPPESGRSTS